MFEIKNYFIHLEKIFFLFVLCKCIIICDIGLKNLSSSDFDIDKKSYHLFFTSSKYLIGLALIQNLKVHIHTNLLEQIMKSIFTPIYSGKYGENKSAFNLKKKWNRMG